MTVGRLLSNLARLRLVRLPLARRVHLVPVFATNPGGESLC